MRRAVPPAGPRTQSARPHTQARARRRDQTGSRPNPRLNAWPVAASTIEIADESPPVREPLLSTASDLPPGAQARVSAYGTAPSAAGWSSDNTLLLLVSPPLACLRSQPHLPRGECSDAAQKLAVVPIHGTPVSVGFGPGHGFRSAVWSPKTHQFAFVRLARVGRLGADSSGSIEVARVGAGRVQLSRMTRPHRTAAFESRRISG
jgi:hypothetical protein